jgi:hypothetical protein
MKRILTVSAFGLIAWLVSTCGAFAQPPSSSFPYYIPQGPQRGTYGYPLYFVTPGTSNGVMVTYNFGAGRIREFNYGMFTPGGVAYSRGLGGGNSAFATSASSALGNSLPGYPGGHMFAPFYAGPAYYLPTY